MYRVNDTVLAADLKHLIDTECRVLNSDRRQITEDYFNMTNDWEDFTVSTVYLV